MFCCRRFLSPEEIHIGEETPREFFTAIRLAEIRRRRAACCFEGLNFLLSKDIPYFRVSYSLSLRN